MVFQQVVGLFIGGIGALFAYKALKTYRIAKRRQRFEPITATIVDSQLEESTVSGGGPENPGGHSTKYRPHIRWEYTVSGETYTNNKRYSGSGDKEEEQEVVDKYPQGETVEIEYDPTNPSVSFLERVPKMGDAVVTGIVGGILSLFGLALLVLTPL